MRKTIAFLATVGLMIPLAAHAMNERVWLLLNGGAGTYTMSDLNTELDAANAANAGTGWSFAHVEKGRLFGGAMGFETGGKWNFGLGMDRLAASTRASDASGALEWNLSANVWRLFGEYSLRPVGQSSVFVGGAIGLVQENGKMIVSQPGYAPAEYKMSGKGPSYEGHVGGNWWATPLFALTATVGYRHARVDEVMVEGIPFIMSNGEAMSLDFSGPSARIGIKIAAKDMSQ